MFHGLRIHLRMRDYRALLSFLFFHPYGLVLQMTVALLSIEVSRLLLSCLVPGLRTRMFSGKQDNFHEDLLAKPRHKPGRRLALMASLACGSRDPTVGLRSRATEDHRLDMLFCVGALPLRQRDPLADSAACCMKSNLFTMG